MYRYKVTIKLHETDAAGLLFFSHQFKLIHDAYESLLDSINIGFPVLIRQKSYFLPIVHAECDYKAPLFVGDEIDIQVDVENIGTTSFTFVYKLFNKEGKIVGTGQTVHVTMDKKTQQKIPLPDEMRKAIESLQ